MGARIACFAAVLLTTLAMLMTTASGSDFTLGQTVPPILDTASLPGLQLHRSTVDGVSTLDDLRRRSGRFARSEAFVLTREVVSLHEFWMDMSAPTLNKLIREGRLKDTPRTTVSVSRVILATPAEAMEYARITLPRPGTTGIWKEGLPGASRVGDASWYYVGLTRPGTSSEEAERVRLNNENGLRVLFVKGRTVVKFTAFTAGGRALDRDFAQLVRLVAGRL